MVQLRQMPAIGEDDQLAIAAERAEARSRNPESEMRVTIGTGKPLRKRVQSLGRAIANKSSTAVYCM